MKSKTLLLFFALVSLFSIKAENISISPVSEPYAKYYVGFSLFSEPNIPIGYDSEQRYDGTENVTVYFYNTDFSLRKSVTVTPTHEGRKGQFWLDWLESDNIGRTFYASQHLFNSDDLFEFVVYGYFDNGDDTRIWKYLVYNENGNCLGQLPDNLVLKFGDNVFFKDYNSPTGLSQLSINGAGINDIVSSKIKYTISPNPVCAGTNVNINFSQPIDYDCNLTFVDYNGCIVFKTRIPQYSNSFSIPCSKLKVGFLIYSLQIGTHEIETGKIIIN